MILRSQVSASRTLSCVLAVSAVLALLSACVGPPAPSPIPTAPLPSPTSVSESILGDGPTELDCNDGFAGTGDSSSSSADVLLGGLARSVVFGDTRPNVPLARDVNLIVPLDVDWRFAKSPLSLAAGPEAITVTVPQDGQQFLVWTTQVGWTGDSPVVVADWAQTSLTISPCSNHGVTFLGGILARSADHCFAITFRTASDKVDQRELRLDGKDC